MKIARNYLGENYYFKLLKATCVNHGINSIQS